MKKNLIVFGTRPRPEAIKMAPLVKEFQKHPDFFETKICITAQHREMLDQVLDFFEISPDYGLDLMKPNQNLYSLTGDTTTTIASFYSGASVCHVETGLRTFNMKSPFPEEMNRCVTGVVSNIHFSPTETSKQNLIKENKSSGSILGTGNTVIDALQFSAKKVRKNGLKIKI